MALARVVFRELLQDSQELGSNEEHMVSRVLFDLELDGKHFPGLYAHLKQTVGTSYESAALEVTKPLNYAGPFNFEAFREGAERYYRGLIGSSGRGIRIAPGAVNVRMYNCHFVQPMAIEFEVSVSGGPW